MTQHRYHDSRHNLCELVHAALARSPYVAKRNLSAELQGDEVVLKGIVSTFYQKQLAQESIRSIEGIGRIRNEIEVISA